MFLKCCLNGPRRPAEHAALPVTAAALARDAARVAAAGADAVHVHPKDGAGADTLNPVVVAAVVEAIRAAAPGLPIGLTTGAWASPDPAARVRIVESWTVRPDFASVNWHEAGADDVAAALLGRGVGVEAGLWHADAVRAWSASPHRDACLRVMIELPDGLDPAATVAEADRLLALVKAGRTPGGAGDGGRDAGRDPGRPPVLLHGEGSSCWPALGYAAELGLQARIGLEDVLTLPAGTPAQDNAALVTAARSLFAARA